MTHLSFKNQERKKNVIINPELGKSPLTNNEGELFWKQLDSILVGCVSL